VPEDDDIGFRFVLFKLMIPLIYDCIDILLLRPILLLFHVVQRVFEYIKAPVDVPRAT